MTGPRPRAGLAALLAAGVLAVGGGSAVGWSLTHQRHAPQPTAAAAGSLDDGAGQPTNSAAAGSRRPRHPGVLTRSLPVSIRIPAIRVTSPVNPLGLASDGSLAVPTPGPHYNEVAWYDGSPTPGQRGPAVLEGHVDSASQGPSVFFRLGALTPGERIYVTRADHRTTAFTINAVRRYSKDAFPQLLVYGNTVDAQLRLITCGGRFDSSTGHYRDNIVVFASLISVTSP
jgi:hypothetical protein